MFYCLAEPTKFDGKSKYINITQHFDKFVVGDELSLDIKFKTNEIYKYMTLIGIYYKFRRDPDFYINIERSYLTVGVMKNRRNIAWTAKEACSNGKEHFVQFRAGKSGITVYLDGVEIMRDETLYPYCDYRYVEDVTIGRGVVRDEYDNHFSGDILEFKAWNTEEPVEIITTKEDVKLEKLDLFYKGLAGCENYRIPLIITTKSGVTIATCDVRYDAVGDTPNHIMRGIRTSNDSGKTWSDILITHDFGGKGIADGAGAIDGSLLYDDETDTVWMIYCHAPSGVGNATSVGGTGFDDKGRKILFAKDGTKFFVEKNKSIVDGDGNDTGYSIDAYEKLYKNGECCGSVCHGADRVFSVLNTAYLHIIKSTDDGKTWSEPRELNPEIKKEWMRGICAGPSNGIKIKNGKYKGRLIYSIYFSSIDAKRVTSPVSMYSDNKGETWHMGTPVNDNREFEGKTITARYCDDFRVSMSESKIIEIGDGNLRIFMRNFLYKTTAIADSFDGGETWVNVRQSRDLVDPKCQTNLLRIERDGKVYHLFSNPEKEDKRVNGTVKISLDNTETWIAKRQIEPGEFSYSCMTELPDGQIGLLYEGKQLTQRFVKFPLDWLLIGD